MGDLLLLDTKHRKVIHELTSANYSPQLFCEILSYLKHLSNDFETFEDYAEEFAGIASTLQLDRNWLGNPPQLYSDFHITIEVNYESWEMICSRTEIDKIIAFAQSLEIYSFFIVGEFARAFKAAGYDGLTDTDITWFEEHGFSLETLKIWEKRYDPPEKVKDILTTVALFHYRLQTDKREFIYIPVVAELPAKECAHCGQIMRMEAMFMEPASLSDNEDQIKLLTRFVGSEKDQAEMSSSPVKAFRKYVNHNFGSISSAYKGAVAFGQDRNWYRGESFSAGLSALLVIQALQQREMRTKPFFAKNCAITGSIEESGDINAVNPDTCSDKAEVCFFSPVDVLIVPNENYELIREKLSELFSLYPNKKLELIGVNQLGDIIADRRVIDYRKTPISKWVLYKSKKHSGPLLSAAIVLLAVLSFSIFGEPRDQNPVAFEARGETILFKNVRGQVIHKLEVNNTTVNQLLESNSSNQIFTFFDITGDGRNEFLYVNNKNNRYGLTAYSTKDGKELWRFYPEYDLDYRHNPEVVNTNLSAGNFIVVEDEDKEATTILIISGTTLFQYIVNQLNIYTGEVLQAYIHAGRLKAIQALDISGDGQKEVILAGTNNAFNEAVISVLQLNNMNGQSPATWRYSDAKTEIANHLAYIRVPKTTLFDKVPVRTNRNEILSLSLNDQMVRFQISEFPHITSSSHDQSHKHLYFDLAFNPIGMAATDHFDRIVAELERDGLLHNWDTLEYLAQRMDEYLYYQNDGSWKRWGDLKKEVE